MSDEDEKPFCGDTIEKIGYYYRANIDQYIFIPICVIGMILNLLNALVFTRKPMNSSPNLILANLAFVDLLMLLSNILNESLINIHNFGFLDVLESYEWTMLFYYSDIFVVTFQFMSISLTVQLAAWRYIAVVHPLKERHWCSKKITRNVVIAVYIICCASIIIPAHFSFYIEAVHEDQYTYYIATTTDDRSLIMKSIRNMVFGLMVKLLPSVILAGLTLRIVVTLLARKSHREELTASAGARNNMENVETRQQTNRSTAILLAVVALFFIAEFPRGMLWLIKENNEYDWSMCYASLVPFFITMSNIYTSITFGVYYILSKQFRSTFKSLFNVQL